MVGWWIITRAFGKQMRRPVPELASKAAMESAFGDVFLSQDVHENQNIEQIRIAEILDFERAKRPCPRPRC